MRNGRCNFPNFLQALVEIERRRYPEKYSQNAAAETDKVEAFDIFAAVTRVIDVTVRPKADRAPQLLHDFDLVRSEQVSKVLEAFMPLLSRMFLFYRVKEPNGKLPLPLPLPLSLNLALCLSLIPIEGARH